MNSDEIERFLRARVRDFDGVFSIHNLSDDPHLLILISVGRTICHLLLFVSERTTCCPRQLFAILEFSSRAMSLCGLMCRVRCPDVLLCYDSSAASDAQCPILCSICWSCHWLCHVSTTATQHSQDFLRLSSVDFSRFSIPPPD